MPSIYIPFTGRVDRRLSRDAGKEGSVIFRGNFLVRDAVMARPRGTSKAINTELSDVCTWIGRYYTVEVGQVSPKTFAYTQDGKLWRVNDAAKTAAVVIENLNTNAYPVSAFFKSGEQIVLYLVDGKDLWKYDGNNDDNWEKVDITNNDGTTINPIDLLEHRDRLCLISETDLYISKNLEPDVFDDATDSLDVIVGSGRGRNLAVEKIRGNDTLYVFNTEGIYALYGDTISAVAITFEIRLVDKGKILAGRSAVSVEDGIIYLADDFNLWSFNGNTSTKLTHQEKLELDINPYRDYLNKAVANYEDNYYKISFVENAQTTNNLEFWWDALEERGDFVRGRNVTAYLNYDATREIEKYLVAVSTTATKIICFANEGYSYNNLAIRSRLWTKSYPMIKGHNCRIVNMYPDIDSTGTYAITMYYFLDSRLSPNIAAASWAQKLEGEFNQLGAIHFSNQTDFTDRVKPNINYAKGETIGFYIDDSTLNMEVKLKGMTVEFVDKGLKKGKKIGQ